MESCQRFTFAPENSVEVEVLLVHNETEASSSFNGDAWVNVVLKNFTGRLIVRKQPEQFSAIFSSLSSTPVHKNYDEEDYVDNEVPSSPEAPDVFLPHENDVSAMGFAVIDNGSLSLPAIAEVATADDDVEPDSISEQAQRLVEQVGDPSREEEDSINFTDASDREGSEMGGGSIHSDRGAQSDPGPFVGGDLSESSYMERAGRSFSERPAGSFSDRDTAGFSERRSFSERAGGSFSERLAEESDPDAAETNHSESDNAGSDLDGSKKARKVLSKLVEGSQRGRKVLGGGKRRRPSSLGPRRGDAQTQSSPGALQSGNELFNRAVNMFSKNKGESNRRTSSKELPSMGDASERSDSARGGPDRAVESKPGKAKSHRHTSSWAKVLQVYSVKKHVPALIRQKRIEERRSLSTNQASSLSLFPSRLHELCAEPDATLAELIESLEVHKSAVFKKDRTGKLPLHILGDNEGLVSTAQGKQVASAFAWKLMEANPDAITEVDNQGHMPFVTLIADWVAWVYESHRKIRKAKQAASPGLFLRGGNTTDNTTDSNTATNNTENNSNTNRDATSNAFFSRKAENASSTTRLFPKPEVWDEVEWCFSMLSLALDELAGKSGVLYKATKRDVFASHHNHVQSKVKKPDSMRRELVCHLISVMPHLLKTVLLIETEGGETRRRILKMTVFRRMFLCKECIGDWLTQMLRKTGSASRRGVDFLEQISDTKISDYTGGFRATAVEDAEKYHEEQVEVFQAVNDLEGTIGSLVTMENRQTERAAATKVIWHIMGERLARPFVLGLVLVDLVLHISLMIAFRNNVQITESTIGEISTQSVLFICSHYLIRKGCEGLALLSISPSIFRGYFMNVWTLFDLMAIIMAMAAFAWNTKNPGTYRNGFNAFVVGLLWMKVVGFLKVVNKDMSTFILALLEILQDIKYFLVVLVVVIFMFGDMFHLAVSTKDNGTFCDQQDLEGPTLDFCNRELTSSYLRVYSILLGDFELNDLQDSTAITTIYVIFTSLGVVILLNVLIAVISDSYEKATVSSAMLFGRARVMFVAQNEALEAFLKPGVNPMQAFQGIMAPRTVLSRLFTIFRWCVLLAIITTACDTAVFLVSLSIDTLRAQDNRDPSFVTAILLFVMFLILASALSVLIGFAFDGLVRRLFPAFISRAFDRLNRISVNVVRWLAFRLFGLHSRKHQDTRASADDWTGRLNYMESMFERIVQDSKKELIAEMSALETRLYEHDLETRQTINQTESGSPSRASSRNLMTFPMRRS